MLPPLPVNRAFTPAYGEAVTLSPLVRRIVARNPSPFTFHGTGTYLVGRGTVAVLDPGPDDPAHLEAILAATAGETITHCVVTHTHSDHAPLARPLAGRTGAMVVGCGPEPAHGGAHGGVAVEEGGDTTYRPDRQLGTGARITGDGWTLEAIATPGHTSNHLAFALPEERALFPGDHVMGWSSTVVAPPDGDMEAYIASLETVRQRDDAVLYPTHGAPVGGPHDALARRPAAFVAALIAHRRAREAQILDALATGPATIQALVPVLYADVDPRLHPAAAMSVWAHLIALLAEGRAAAEGAATLGALYRRC